MEELKPNQEASGRVSYYQKNKHKYKKGGKYYYYKTVDETRPKIPLSIRQGNFIISFD